MWDKVPVRQRRYAYVKLVKLLNSLNYMGCPGRFLLRYSRFPRRLELGRASYVQDVSALGAIESLDVLNLDALPLSGTLPP